jgi:signal transduction histidine kinase
MKTLLARFLSLNIRGKVILPYLILTFAVAIVGTYVVTNLVTSSLNERLTNQLLEAGRTVSDDLARREITHLEVARVVAFTRGLNEALYARDQDIVNSLAQPVAASRNIDCLIIMDVKRQELLHMLKQADGTFQVITGQFDMSGLWIAQELLRSGNPNSLPKRALGQHPMNNRYYYFTAIPVGLNGQVIGAIVVGTSLDTLMPYFKTSSLADVTIYLDRGNVIATTFALQGDDPAQQQDLAISPSAYQDVLSSDNSVSGENLQVHGRWYRIARGPLRVSGDKLAVFSVALPLNFILQASATSRDTYVLLFAAAMVCVVIVGYMTARRITRPLSRLVSTSRAIAGGDLSQRTGIHSQDEIGMLAASFDTMTERLVERTRELERAYSTLEQMDKTKADFIDVAAHELRTPLTLINGYAQLLKTTMSNYPEALELVEGIVVGSNRMREVVNSMLDVSKIDSQTLDVDIRPTVIAELFGNIQGELKLALKERSLTLTVEGLEGLPRVEADPDLLLKVFYQLVINAVKYTPDGGSITVSGRLVDGAEKPEVEILVSDTGIGIDPAQSELIFEKFYHTGRVSLYSTGKTKFKGGGPGLGLAIARGIVGAHNGRIWVESDGYDEQRCAGSRFYVRLPVSRM